MPEMNGFEATLQIRQSEEGRRMGGGDGVMGGERDVIYCNRTICGDCGNSEDTVFKPLRACLDRIHARIDAQWIMVPIDLRVLRQRKRLLSITSIFIGLIILEFQV